MHWTEESLIQTPDDIQKYLGVGLYAQPFLLKQAYQSAVKARPDLKKHLRLACKIADDPYYRSAFQRYGTLKDIAEAGFFDDGLEPGHLLKLMDPNWLVTPLDKLLHQIALLKDKPQEDQPRVVLLTTGCFAPVHEGHIAMMNAAWKRLSSAGYAVLGGFFSTSHDDYVSTKGSDAASYYAGVRIRALNKALSESDWLMADPWEALHTPVSVNFTDVIRRLKHYINRHVTSHPPLEIAYVFGSDNADFARAFVHEGLGVCVSRPGHEANIEKLERDRHLSNGRILFTDPTQDGQYTPKVSSTRVRKGEHPALSLIQDEVASLDGPRLAHSNSTPQTYLIRDDARWGARLWDDVCPQKTLSEACDAFSQGLSKALQAAFQASSLPGYPEQIKPLLMGTAMQRAAATEIGKRQSVINNDVVTAGDGISVGVSRLFSLSAPQFKAGQLLERPENIGSLSRLKSLKPGDYKLMDDDIATGTTMRGLAKLLPEGCNVAGTIALSEIAFRREFPNEPYKFWDVVDARDFLLGSFAGGLVVQLFNQQIARAPYISPYVSLASRANVPPNQERQLSLDILDLNTRFFEAIGDIALRRTSQPFQNLMAAAGFSPDTPMTEVCARHKEMLCLGAKPAEQNLTAKPGDRVRPAGVNAGIQPRP